MDKRNRSQSNASNLPTESGSPPNETRQPVQAILDVTTLADHSTRELEPRSRWLMFGDMALASALQKERRTNFKKLRTRFKNHHLTFLQADLDLGLTMARIAARANSGSEKREKPTRNAREAYLTVLRFREKVDMTPKQGEELRLKSNQLRGALLDLGEPWQSLPMVA